MSEYLVHFYGGLPRELFQSIEDLIIQHRLQVSYEKVLGHSDDINNSRADMLANGLAAKGKS